ncbi:hypothetical protein DY000_02023414 [Brassica cretica]|uniref:Uncharacterized protein n=1 Tax=Brassica cretica TaxID=69181 RepID=A0ABQ7E8Q8_BRACR|nr:hypothetical protein DY000_02023414 [Brassica cretica]
MSGLRRLASADPFRMSSSPYREASLLQNCYGTRGPEDYGEYHPGAQSFLDLWKLGEARGLSFLTYLERRVASKTYEGTSPKLPWEFVGDTRPQFPLEIYQGSLSGKAIPRTRSMGSGTWMLEPGTLRVRDFLWLLLVVAWYACSVPTMTPMPLEFVEVVYPAGRRCVLLENLASDPIDVDDDRPCWVRRLLRLDGAHGRIRWWSSRYDAGSMELRYALMSMKCPCQRNHSTRKPEVGTQRRDPDPGGGPWKLETGTWNPGE